MSWCFSANLVPLGLSQARACFRKIYPHPKSPKNSMLNKMTTRKPVSLAYFFQIFYTIFMRTLLEKTVLYLACSGLCLWWQDITLTTIAFLLIGLITGCIPAVQKKKRNISQWIPILVMEKNCQWYTHVFWFFLCFFHVLCTFFLWFYTIWWNAVIGFSVAFAPFHL